MKNHAANAILASWKPAVETTDNSFVQQFKQKLAKADDGGQKNAAAVLKINDPVEIISHDG